MPEIEGETDAALVRACLDGAPGAFERLVERHRRVVYHAIRAALARTGARGDADLCDEAFVRVFSALAAARMKALRRFEGRSRLSTFLVVVARRVALRVFSEARPRLPGAVPERRGDDPVDLAPGPSERAEREEARALVREVVGLLPPRDALAIRLFYEHDLGHREIGAVLGVPVTHVGQILARAREKLRAPLVRAGLGAERQSGVS
jgi:RNA polymerase sigma-70 factor (ECF subfamily)